MAVPQVLNRAKESASYFMNILKAPILPLYRKSKNGTEDAPQPAVPPTVPLVEPSPSSSAFNLLSSTFLASKVPEKLVFAKKVTTMNDFEAKLAMPFCQDLRDFVQSFVDEFNKIGDEVDRSINLMAEDQSDPIGAQTTAPSWTSSLGQPRVETEEDILRDRIQLQRGAAFKAWLNTVTLHFAAHKAWEGDFSGPDDPKLNLFLEQYVVERIYNHLFFPNKKRDFLFAQWVQGISHMTAESLDIKHPVTEDLINYCGSCTPKVTASYQI